jgi:hypothetical protein
MGKKRKILFKQLEELMILRERSIENIYSSSNSYLTFLGLTITALAIFIDISNPNDVIERIELIKHIILVFIGIAVCFYGWFIYHHIWSFYVGQIKYTKMINMTRAYLTKELEMSEKLLLPTSRNRPSFDDQGYLGKKFSKNGVVSWIKWANSIIAFLTIFAFVTLFEWIPAIRGSEIFRLYAIIMAFISSLIGAVWIQLIHNRFNREFLRKAKKDWIKNIACKKEKGYINIC